MGGEVETFERQFASYFGSDYHDYGKFWFFSQPDYDCNMEIGKNPVYRLQAGDEIIVPAVS